VPRRFAQTSPRSGKDLDGRFLAANNHALRLQADLDGIKRMLHQLAANSGNLTISAAKKDDCVIDKRLTSQEQSIYYTDPQKRWRTAVIQADSVFESGAASISSLPPSTSDVVCIQASDGNFLEKKSIRIPNWLQP
jgi:hypothetical protein